MDEASLKAQLCAALRKLPHSKVIRHEDIFTAGVPDISVTYAGHTTWLEVKHLKKSKRVPKNSVQLITAIELARAGRCRYVLYFESKGDRQTVIVHPRLVHLWPDDGLAGDELERVAGFSHEFVVDYILRTHQG